MSANEEDPVIRPHREEAERMRREGVPSPRPAEPPTILYAELPEAGPDSPVWREWNFYRREVGRLLAEGLEGRWVLIEGATLLGIWDTQAEADAVRLERFRMQPLLTDPPPERGRGEVNRKGLPSTITPVTPRRASAYPLGRR